MLEHISIILDRMGALQEDCPDKFLERVIANPVNEHRCEDAWDEEEVRGSYDKVDGKKKK